MIYICNYSDIQENTSKGFVKSNKNFFLVKKDGQIYAYENLCPHLQIPLEMEEDQFLDYENHFIQCSTHGAIFNIESGTCIAGPCAGKALIPIAIQLNQNKVYAKV